MTTRGAAGLFEHKWLQIVLNDTKSFENPLIFRLSNMIEIVVVSCALTENMKQLQL